MKTDSTATRQSSTLNASQQPSNKLDNATDSFLKEFAKIFESIGH